MAIRDHNSAQSGTEELERQWFKKAELLDNEIHRYLFMERGNRNKVWDMRADLTVNDANDTVWMIDHDKFVNRPDAIAHKFYGNSKYWWLIAEKNGISDPFTEFYKGRKLRIPDLHAVRNLLGL